MQSGQRGAAHVNIFFFLIMLVLFLGALAFAYVTLENNTKLLEDIKAANATAEDATAATFLYEHYVEDLAKEIGETGEYAGRAGFDYSTYGSPDPLQNVTVPSRARTTMADFAKAVEVPESRGLSNLFGHVKGAFDKFQQQAAAMASQKATVDNEVAQLKSQISDLTATQRREVDRLNSALSQTRADYDADRSEKDNTIRSANQEYTRIREERSDQAAEHALIVAGLRKEIETLGARIDAAADKVKLLNPSSEPDGMVIDSSQATGLAWINIGRRDLLPIGTTFEIIKPDSYEVKAFATVRRLEQTRAEVRVTGLRDRFDPVMPGDRVRNDLYSPDMRHNIYLMGRFSQPYTRPLVKTLLENLGNRVVDELGPGVDLVLLGGDAINDERSGFTPLTETEEFKAAQFLRVEMAPLSKVRQYLKLTDDMISAR